MPLDVMELSKSVPSKEFPHSEVLARLRTELITSVRGDASISGIQIPEADDELVHLAFEVDSMICVNILCSIEPVLGIELREGIVNPGGYNSVNEAICHILPRIKQYWDKKVSK